MQECVWFVYVASVWASSVMHMGVWCESKDMCGVSIGTCGLCGGCGVCMGTDGEEVFHHVQRRLGHCR